MRKLKKTIDSAVRNARRECFLQSRYRVVVKIMVVQPDGNGKAEEVSLPCRLRGVYGRYPSTEVNLVASNAVMVQSGEFFSPISPAPFMVMP